jgi:hypothetical protein
LYRSFQRDDEEEERKRKQVRGERWEVRGER